mmetsp:Transcript_15617/g.44881  ORF Transcript_15617/g.44881 Transcript_15617/m.44881 type:complete len:207 (+) Transcript_15617:266-886(+)
MRRPLPLGLSPRSGRSLAPGRLLRAALRAPSALSRLAKGKTRAAPRRRSADQRPAAARSARLVAGRRRPRRAAGGSLGRHSHAAFFPQGWSPARGQQRALAGALSAIREQAPLAHDPPSSHAGEARAVAWEGRSRGRATAMQGLAVGLRAPSGSRLLGHHVPTLRRSVSVRLLFVLAPLLLVARRSSPLESRDSSVSVCPECCFVF